MALKLLDPHREEVEGENLISVIKSRDEKQLEDFLLAFINRSEDPHVIQAMAKLLSLLIGDATMSSVVPFTYHQHLLETCAAIRHNSAFHTKLQEMKEYGVELSEMLYISTLHNIGTLCLEFVEYVVDKIVNVHANDKDTPPVTVIEQSYNPESGVCYYFTPHGKPNKKTA